MMHAVADHPRSVPGMVVSLQTYRDQIANWHPHCHAIVTDGVFRPDGSFHLCLPPTRNNSCCSFAINCCKSFCAWRKSIPATIEILDRFRHTGFSVYQSPPVLPSDTAAREKLAVYISRAPISLDRLSYDGPNGTVDYRPKSSPGHPPSPTMFPTRTPWTSSLRYRSYSR